MFPGDRIVWCSSVWSLERKVGGMYRRQSKWGLILDSTHFLFVSLSRVLPPCLWPVSLCAPVSISELCFGT